MNKIIKQATKLIRQLSPDFCPRRDPEIIAMVLYQYLDKIGAELIGPVYDERALHPTVEYIEECYEIGYAAVINDGKLLGFIREK